METEHRVTPGSRPLVMGFGGEGKTPEGGGRGGGGGGGGGSSGGKQESGTGEGVPVTVLTGFLGSGKTTLLNRILTENHGKRIAVIQNEFGEDLGLGSTLAAEGKGAEVFEECYEMNNGCICCSVRDDLVNTLEAIMRKRDKFDHVIVETTGLANPGPIASIFWLDDELGSDLFLDAIVTLVDAKHITRHLDDPDCTEAAQQIAFADRVLINKKDLVSEEELDAVESRVRTINALAPAFRTVSSELDLDHILSIRAFDSARAMEVDRMANTDACQECGHESGHGDHSHSHGPSKSHDQSVGTVAVRVEGDVELDLVQRWLGEMLWEGGEGDNIFRIKGIIAARGEPRRVTLQGVHNLFDTETCVPWEEGQQRYTKIVFIGRKLQHSKLQAGLEACISKP